MTNEHETMGLELDSYFIWRKRSLKVIFSGIQQTPHTDATHPPTHTFDTVMREIICWWEMTMWATSILLSKNTHKERCSCICFYYCWVQHLQWMRLSSCPQTEYIQVDIRTEFTTIRRRNSNPTTDRLTLNSASKLALPWACMLSTCFRKASYAPSFTTDLSPLPALPTGVQNTAKQDTQWENQPHGNCVCVCTHTCMYIAFTHMY